MAISMVLFRTVAAVMALGVSVAAGAQEGPTVSPPATVPIIFSPGTGGGAIGLSSVPFRPMFSCDGLSSARATIAAFYPAKAVQPALAAVQSATDRSRPQHRIDQKLLGEALGSYAKHHCSYGRTAGPAIIIVVDFAKRSDEPRMYRIDLRDGRGIDEPILVAHGIGSDPNDDGIADAFSDVKDSLMSSLGPARGSEIYVGINGRSLRLDGLEAANMSMRARDIVVHSYSPTTMRYFNGELLIARGGRPGTSEGCFVVEPYKRDLVMQTLVDGGFLYAGYSGELPKARTPVPGQSVTFVHGTGAITRAVPVTPILGTAAETAGSQPTTPISPAPTTPLQ